MFTTPRPPSRLRRLTGLLLPAALLGWALAAPSPARAGSLERALLNEAPEVLRFLREHGYRHVGILKFRVQKDGPPSSNVGPLNLNLAHRLETALLLKYDVQKDSDLVLLHDASEVAAAIPGADHLTTAGRARLFQGKYLPLWGKQSPVAADAFLVGRADFSKDLRTINLNLCAFGRDLKPEKVLVLHARTEMDTLAEAGESFSMRAFVRGDGTVEEADLDGAAADKAQEAKKGNDDRKLLADLPVLLEVHYVDRQTGNDQSVPVRVKGGQATIPEPTDGQDLYFVLRRNDPSQARYGVVLLVNGVNTVFEEQLPPERCTKWIIEPGAAPFNLRGFQQRQGGMHPFVVRSAAESATAAAKYGPAAGIFTFALFREGAKVAKKPAPGGLDGLEKQREEAAVANPPAPPKDLPQDAGPVQDKALEDANKLLGLVEKSGIPIDSEVENVPFVNPVLLETVTIRYYAPPKP